MQLIAAALEEELEAGMALCADRRRIQGVGASLWQAVRGEKTLHFLKTGVGPERSAAKLEEVLKKIKPSQILVVGYAGALDPRLRLGDLVAVGKALAFSLDKNHPNWDHIQLDGEIELAHPGELARRAESAGLSACTGTTMTSSYVLGKPEHKRLLFEKFHAVIVDMETAALASTAAARGIPISCVRVVSDEAQDSFLAPFSHDPETGMSMRALKLLETGMVHTYREWKAHASMARESLSRFLALYL